MNKPDGVSACHQTKIETAAAFPADAPSLHHSAQCIHLSIHTSPVCPTCRIFERLAKNGVRGVFFKQIWYDKILILGWGCSSYHFDPWFTVVTLSNNNEQPQYANRVILSVNSPFFENNVKYNSNANTFI